LIQLADCQATRTSVVCIGVDGIIVEFRGDDNASQEQPVSIHGP
jgi:hypothetical protein